MKHLLHSFAAVSQRLANALTATGQSAQRRSAAADPAQEGAASAPAFTKAWMALPAPGQSAVIKVRARYLYKGEEFGNWCEWHTWTLTGS